MKMSVYTSKKTLCLHYTKRSQFIPQRKHYASIIWTCRLVFLSEITTIYSDNLVKLIYTLCGKNFDLFNLKSGGKYSYYRTLNCYWYHKHAKESIP
jgi:hypothetical protein